MKIFLTIIALFTLTVNTAQNNAEKCDFLETKFNDTKKVIESWNNSNFNYSFKIKHNEKYFNVFKVKEYNEIKGHFVLNENGDLESFYVGDTSKIDYSKESMISPIFAKDNDYNIKDDEILPINNNFTPIPPVLNVDLYKTSSSSFHSEQLITDCPYYYNEPNGPVINGCSPTTAAMLLSFYDRYSELDNLLDEELPLNHEENRTRVDNFIKELAVLMGTNTIVPGTTVQQIVSGYNKYLLSKGYFGYQASVSYNYDDYSYFINTLKNPAHLCIYTDDTKDNLHSVLGVGTATLKDSGRFMVTHYAVEDNKRGNYYVSEKYFLRFYYLGSCL